MVKFYKSVFKGTKVGKFSYWGKNPHGVKEGSVLTAFDKWNTTKNKAKKEAMMFELWKMKKPDIKKLKAAFNNA